MTDPVLTYYGTKTGDDLRFPSRMRAEMLAALPDGEIEVTVRRKRVRTSDPQRRYYFGVIVEALLHVFREWSPDIGWTKEAVHEVLKERFLPLVREWGETVVPATGEVIRERMSTEKLTKTERELYHDHCRKFAAEMDIIIPLPNEQAELSLENINI
jgi:hypothetical protein